MELRNICLLYTSHLLAQFCRKPVCLLLPLGRLLDRFIRLRVNALQPPPERLIDRKIELRARCV